MTRAFLLWLVLAVSLSAQTVTLHLPPQQGQTLTIILTPDPPAAPDPPPVVVPPPPPVVVPPVVVPPPVVAPPPVVVPPVVVAPPPTDPLSALPLVTKDTLQWVCAFKLPTPGGALYSQGALAFNPARNSLFVGGIAGETQPQWAIEVSIPPCDATASATATILQPAADVFDGKRWGDLMGGLFVYGGRLIATNYVYYGASPCSGDHTSHAAAGLDLSVKDDVVGPIRVETTGMDPKACTGLRAGFVAGYMADIPKPWQTALGGPAFTGACCLSIIERTSLGPTVSVFDPDQIGKGPVPATMVVGYPIEHSNAEGLGPLAYDKTTGSGAASWSSEYFNITTVIRGVVFPEGTRSVLFFGKHGPGTFCYGDSSLTTGCHQTKPQPLPGAPFDLEHNGEMVCFIGPAGGHSPFSTTPDCTKPVYREQIWAYDALDLAAVKAGTKKPWEVLPYAIWTPQTPLGDHALPTWSQTSGLLGVAYDAKGGNIYVYQPDGNGHPIIDVYRVQ